jgi:hypothetical protein
VKRASADRASVRWQRVAAGAAPRAKPRRDQPTKMPSGSTRMAARRAAEACWNRMRCLASQTRRRGQSVEGESCDDVVLTLSGEIPNVGVKPTPKRKVGIRETEERFGVRLERQVRTSLSKRATACPECFLHFRASWVHDDVSEACNQAFEFHGGCGWGAVLCAASP